MRELKWINQTFARFFPGQYPSMVAHGVVTLVASVAAALILPGQTVLGVTLPSDRLLTFAVTATIGWVLYKLREGRQKRKWLAQDKAWTDTKQLARGSDLIGPMFVMVTAWAMWMLS